MTKKEIAKSFLKLAGMGDVDTAYNNFVADEFIHHNQYFEGSRKALKQAMKEAHQKSPNKAVEIKQCFQDGDIIITHSLVQKKDMDIAVVHIFKFNNNKIVELWDLGQTINKDSPNQNGLF